LQSESAAGLFRTLEGITPFAQVDPAILNRFDPDQIMKDLADINGMPAKWTKSDDEMAAEQQMQQQQQMAAQMLEAAPIAADVAKKEAETQAIIQGGPQGRI
jgi:hypothetical protein